jgi:UDP-N-acetyl-2-amino-2-deoxyglucuronate dehydrogenase
MSGGSSTRTLLLGCGRVAAHYVDVLTGALGESVVGIEIVGACDVVLDRARSVAERVGGEPYSDLGTAIDRSSPELVVVMTPSGDHHRHARQALEAGCHVLVEKPIAMLPSEGEDLVDLARRSDLHLGVALQNRLNPAVMAVRAARDDLGALVTASARLRWARFQDYYEDGWHGTWAMDGGVINQQALHHLDALQWICGPIESVCAAETRRANVLEAEDTLVATVRFASGALGTIEATTAARPIDLEASLTLTAERGSVSIGGIALNRVTSWRIEGQDEDEVIRTASREVRTGYGDRHVPILQAMVDAVAGRRSAPAVTGEEAAEVTRLIHALYRSAEEGGWVHLADRPVSERLGRGGHGRH